MRTTVLTILTLFQFVSQGSVFSQEIIESKADFPVLIGPYLGQKPPGMIPEIFVPEFFHFKGFLGICFSEDGDELYYSQFGGEPRARIMYMKIENGQWLPPQTVPFSGKFEDLDINMSPDGKRIYFTSRRPLKKDGTAKKDVDIWFTEKTDGHWGEPKNIGLPVNTDKSEAHPTISENGNLYFMLNDSNQESMSQLYFAKYENGHYLEPEKLSNEPEFNSMDPFVAPDESYLIFHSDRDGGYGGIDLYISFKDRANDCWTKAINMGRIINSKEFEMCPRVSLDGKYFFFSRWDAHVPGAGQNVKRDFYWVDSKIIDDLKPEKLKQ